MIRVAIHRRNARPFSVYFMVGSPASLGDISAHAGAAGSGFLAYSLLSRLGGGHSWSAFLAGPAAAWSWPGPRRLLLVGSRPRRSLARTSWTVPSDTSTSLATS